MTGDTASLSFILPEPVLPEGIAYHSRVIVTDGAHKLFSGLVTSLQWGALGRGYSLGVSLSSDLALLQSIPFFYPLLVSSVPSTFGGYWPQLWRIATDSSHIISTADVSPSILTAFTGTDNGLTTCGAALLNLLRWQPNIRVYMDYSHNGDRLIIGEPAEPCIIDSTRKLVILDDGSEHPAKMTSCDIATRYDLTPPCVKLVGASNFVAGPAEQQHAPNVAAYMVPVDGYGRNDNKPLGRSSVSSLRQKETVRGLLIPMRGQLKFNKPNYSKSLGTAAQAPFWQGLPQTSKLAKAAASNKSLKWGACHVQEVSAKEAYPETSDEFSEVDESGQPVNEKPANYQVASSWSNMTNVYLHVGGSFTAAPKQSDCTRGLKWCRVSIEQNVYAPRNIKLAGMSAEEMLEIFSGRNTPEGEEPNKWRYCTLKVEGILINRRLTSYYPLTNQPADADLIDPTEPDGGGGGGIGNSGAYLWEAWAQRYYDETRRTVYDGSLSLSDWRGGAGWHARQISVTGLADQWASMSAPVTAASYDLKTRALSLTLGSLEPLTLSDMLERYEASSRLLSSGSAAEAGGASPPAPPDGEDGETAEPNGVAAISPSYSASFGVSINAKKRADFEVVAEGDEYYLEEGIVVNAKGESQLIPRQRIANYSEDKNYSIKLSYQADGSYKVLLISSTKTTTPK